MPIGVLGALAVGIFIIAIVGLIFMFFPKYNKINTIVTFVMGAFTIILGIMSATSFPSNEIAGIVVSIIAIALSITGILLFILKKSSIFITKIFIIFSCILSIAIFFL